MPRGSGQWGLTHDDYGKVWYVNAGGEIGPLDFQQPIHYGPMRMEGEGKGMWKRVWPIDKIPDTQGGRRRLRNDNTLNHFTATSGQAIFRGDRLPEDIRGQLFFCEPVGRLIRRTQIDDTNGKTVLSTPHEDEEGEFMRTTDAYFRPVNMNTGPDGSLYLVDMYRGIIQQGNWTRPGSYLRGVIDTLEMAKVINNGRIYRIVHEDFDRDKTKPELLGKSAKELLPYLAHPNGWWRSTAQKLIVLKQDKSVIPALKNTVLSSTNELERIHALWSLEGLGVVDKSIIKKIINGGDDNMKIQAMRVTETAILDGDKDYLNLFAKFSTDKNPKVVLQYAQTLKRCTTGSSEAALIALQKLHNDEAGLEEVLAKMVYSYEEARIRAAKALEQKKNLIVYEKGQKFYESLCVTCHAIDGKGVQAGELTMAPSFVKSDIIDLDDPDVLIRVALHGLKGNLRGKSYAAGIMTPLKSNNDDYIASVLSYVRNSFDNKGSYVTVEQVAKIRTATKGHDMYTEAELIKLNSAYAEAVKKASEKEGDN
jgi:mono/diheme cytochrome c family protein